MEVASVAGHLAVPDADVLGVHGQRSGLQCPERHLERADVAVDVDRVALRLEREVVELAEHKLLGEVLIPDRHLRLAGARQRGLGGGADRRDDRLRGQALRAATAAPRHGQRRRERGGEQASPRAVTEVTHPMSALDRTQAGCAGVRPAKAHTPAARRASACAATSSSSASPESGSASPNARVISQSANQMFLGSSGPCR